MTEADHSLPQISSGRQQYFEKLSIQRNRPFGVYVALTHPRHVCPHSPRSFLCKGKEEKKIRHMLETLVTMEMMVHSKMGRLDFEEEEKREGEGEGEWCSRAAASHINREQQEYSIISFFS